MGKLEKMTIKAYGDDSFSTEVGELKVQINPSGYSQSIKNNYTETPTIGGTQIARFSNQEAQEQNFEFIFDNSGVIAEGESKPVVERIGAFVKLIYEVDGKNHKPNNLLLSWGSLQFRCFCESINIEYTHFKNNGTPVRAKINAKFLQKITHKEYQKKVQKNSPDMTHRKVITAGVNLSSIAYEIYKDPSYYIELAQYNKLDSFRRIKQGVEIIAPPLKT